MKKRLWKKGDRITPRLRKCPPTDMILEILDIRKNTYYIKEDNKKTEIEHKYLEDSYISENGSRKYVWILAEKGVKNVDQKDTIKNKRTRSTVKRKSKADNDLQEDS